LSVYGYWQLSLFIFLALFVPDNNNTWFHTSLKVLENGIGPWHSLNSSNSVPESPEIHSVRIMTYHITCLHPPVSSLLAAKLVN